MIYNIIMLSCSHKTHKGPSTETKAHTDACFPLTAPVPPENVQQELPLPASPASPCLSPPPQPITTPWQVTVCCQPAAHCMQCP